LPQTVVAAIMDIPRAVGKTRQTLRRTIRIALARVVRALPYDKIRVRARVSNHFFDDAHVTPMTTTARETSSVIVLVIIIVFPCRRSR
jgi:hypothetical protein